MTPDHVEPIYAVVHSGTAEVWRIFDYGDYAKAAEFVDSAGRDGIAPGVFAVVKFKADEVV